MNQEEMMNKLGGEVPITTTVKVRRWWMDKDYIVIKYRTTANGRVFKHRERTIQWKKQPVTQDQIEWLASVELRRIEGIIQTKVYGDARTATISSKLGVKL